MQATCEVLSVHYEGGRVWNPRKKEDPIAASQYEYHPPASPVTHSQAGLLLPQQTSASHSLLRKADKPLGGSSV